MHAESDGRKAQLLIVDDHPMVCQGMAQLINLQDDLQLCWEAQDAEQALAVMIWRSSTCL